MEAFNQLFADDAIWVPVAESRLQGRAAILKDFTLIHTTWAKTTTIASSEVTVQKLSPAVSALFLRLRYLDADGQTNPGENHAVLIVAVKESGLCGTNDVDSVRRVDFEWSQGRGPEAVVQTERTAFTSASGLILAVRALLGIGVPSVLPSLLETPYSAMYAAKKLLAQANDGEASDNITLIVVRFDAADSNTT